MKIGIPCKKCIVRASCNKICKEMKKYDDTFFIKCFCVATLIIYSILTLALLGISIFSTKVALIIGLVLIVINYCIVFYFIGNEEVLKDAKNLYEKLLVFTVLPIIFFPAVITLRLEDEIEIVLYRYNYRINPNAYKLKEERKQKRAGIHWKIWKGKSMD